MKIQFQQEKEEYKETELGLLPEDWDVVRLSDYCDVSSGGSAPQGKKYFNGNEPFIRVRHIDNEEFLIKTYDLITHQAIKDYKLKLFSKGTIVFPKSGASVYLEKRAILPIDAYIVSHLCAVKSKKVSLFQDFLFYFLRSKKLAQKKADGYPTLNLSEVKEINIPFPPLPEQKKIAYVLSTIQTAKEKTENVVNSLKELKKSMMKHLFTYGPVSLEDVEKVRLKKTEIGEIPEGWEVKKIKNLVEKTKQKDMRKENIEFKYIDVSSVNRDNLRVDNYTLHKGKKSPSRARKIVNRDDIIVATVRPTLKRIAKINEEYDNEICSTAFCVLKAKKEILEPNYLFYSVQRSVFMDKLSIIQRGASYPAVTDNDIKNQSIPLPDLSTQQQISQILSTIDAKIQAEENKKNALNELFKSMLHNLMTAKLRVKDLEIKNA